MQTPQIEVSSAVLNWIMAQQIPEKIRHSLYQWESGEKKPTFNQIETVSKATGIPLGYFFLQIPPEEPFPLLEYRTVDSAALRNPSRDLIDTVHDMELVQEWTREHLLAEGAEPLAIVGKLKGEENPVLFAASVRHFLDLAPDWYKRSRSEEDSFKILREAISGTGVLVMQNGIVGRNTHRRLNIEEFRAFSMVDQYAPLIFINAADSKNACLFSLLHEFAHICLGENSLYNDHLGMSNGIRRIETTCNAVAAELLAPHSDFLHEWEKAIKENDPEIVVSILAGFFHCGPTVIARRAMDTGKIDKALYQKIARRAIEQYRRQKQEKQESGGNYYGTLRSRIDQRFFKMLAQSVGEGKTLYSDAYRLTNTDRSTYQTLLRLTEGKEK